MRIADINLMLMEKTNQTMRFWYVASFHTLCHQSVKAKTVYTVDWRQEGLTSRHSNAL